MVVRRASRKSLRSSQMKQEPSFFDDREPELVYIANRLSDALEVEKAFDAADMDYGVEADTYQGGIVFRTERVGAFFYVLKEVADQARQVLVDNRFRPFVE
jgi:hypothetical protein